MKLKFITNAVYVGENKEVHEIPAGQIVELSNDEAAEGYVERGTAIELGNEDPLSEAYRATLQSKPIDLAEQNSGNVQSLTTTPVETETDEKQEGVELE